MRFPTLLRAPLLPLSLSALTLLGGPASPTAAAADAPPCATSGSSHAFPLAARIQGGPIVYEAGGADRAWSIELTNNTARTCANIHPVVVLVDDRRALTAAQPKLEFYAAGRPHQVIFERTDEDELVGAFDDGFPGFTVPPGRTYDVKVRLAITSDAVANDVVVKAAVVQRHDDNGDWVGQSNDYRFRIDADSRADAGTGPAPGRPTAPAASPGGQAPLTEDAGDADELARTGPGTPREALIATAAVLLGGAGALLLARRRR